MQQGKPTEPTGSGDEQLQKAPSMLWFAIPLGLIVLYAVLSR